MRNFLYERATDVSDAIRVHGFRPSSFVAGGTTLLDLMKLDVMRPEGVVDIQDLPLKQVEQLKDGQLKIGALVSNTELAYHTLVAKHYPILSQALLSGASTSLRNKATTAGNLMQRVRCPYFRDGVSACNKRDPGSGCAAIGGVNRSVHAVLGTSDHCIASHPSDMCVAMAAIGGAVWVTGPKGERSIDLLDFHLLPGNTPDREHALSKDEIITHVVLHAPIGDSRSNYVKLRDRASYQFALASSAAIVAIKDGTIQAARIALGGVGTKPWRAEKAEASLIGKKATTALFENAAAIAFEHAVPQSQNAYKIPLGQQAVVRSLTLATR